jgi:sodium/proline symporter
VFKGREVLVSRGAMAAICALAVVLTLSLPATIFDRVLFSWSALGAAFGPVIVARVAGVEPRGLAILASIVLGFATTVIFYIFGQMEAGALEGLPAAMASLAAIPGDPFERIVPWIAPLLILFTLRQAEAPARAATLETAE